MFANNNLMMLNFAFPDVCWTPTPAGIPVPLPYPNFVFSTAHVPLVFNIILSVGLAENLLVMGTISIGDQPGVATGIASHTVMLMDYHILGSFTVFYSVAPATRLTTLTLQNTSNIVGMTITPAQVRVILLG